MFGWALTQTAEHDYDFTISDRVLDRAAAEDRQVCLAPGRPLSRPGWRRGIPRPTAPTSKAAGTATGSGTTSAPARPRTEGCPRRWPDASPNGTPHTRPYFAWHINNEYGAACYCELCAQAFRDWLWLDPRTVAVLRLQ
ncbi:hypothetical protein QFZ56_005840 [Streptomyces achromogenes]|uniref:Glycoside hydrolase family 42 N-terminal domain-containing protein n=1 Tax=Streptomyces achromogenes TaxID=67255 RepID=A0ABU0Q8B9_STRAH|nr:hypothetical protein [Streptomyces achromogenes]